MRGGVKRQTSAWCFMARALCPLNALQAMELGSGRRTWTQLPLGFYNFEQDL